MKKVLALCMALVAAFALTACSSTSKEESSAVDSVADVQTESSAAESSVAEVTDKAVMTYDEYVQAPVDSEVTVETYVQAKQGWWENNGVGNATFYTQAEDGAYFLYNMPCSQEEYDQLTVGTKILVTGFKTEWSGEVEITDATFTIEEGTFVAEPLDVTALLGSDELINDQNKFVSFTDMTIEPSKDAEGNDVAYLYNWDGSGSDGDDLYFNVSSNGQTYTFTVESYLTGAGSEVYEAVKNLSVGDTVDMEGFLYWYEGVNPHITSVTVK